MSGRSRLSAVVDSEGGVSVLVDVEGAGKVEVEGVGMSCPSSMSSSVVVVVEVLLVSVDVDGVGTWMSESLTCVVTVTPLGMVLLLVANRSLTSSDVRILAPWIFFFCFRLSAINGGVRISEAIGSFTKPILTSKLLFLTHVLHAEMAPHSVHGWSVLWILVELGILEFEVPGSFPKFAADVSGNNNLPSATAVNAICVNFAQGFQSFYCRYIPCCVGKCFWH